MVHTAIENNATWKNIEPRDINYNYIYESESIRLLWSEDVTGPVIVSIVPLSAFTNAASVLL